MLERERISISQEQKIKKTSEFKTPKEVETWIQKIEKEQHFLNKPVTDDSGQVLVSSPTATKPKIVLPMEKDEFITSLKKNVSEAARWLAEWCFRLIKMKPDKVGFQNADNK